MKTFLRVPDEDALSALTLGAMRDAESGRYFVPPGLEIAQFKPWLPSPSQSLELEKPAQKGCSLSQMLTRVERALDTAFPRSEWVRFEISGLRPGTHAYFDAVERGADGREVSKARAIIWGSLRAKLDKKFFDATGARLENGLKVLMLAKVQFSVQHGLSLIVSDIDPDYTLGDMQAKLKRIREELEAAGIADRNRSLPAPVDFTHVAVIAPNAAAGLEDFQVEAQRLERAGLCRFRYFHAVFQGEKARDSLKQAFIDVHTYHTQQPIDALIVIRGGGATTDLQWLNEGILAKMVCRFHVPVFTGIGHERDSTILDECAHRRFGTPSKVIAHVRDLIAARANRALEDWTQICEGISLKLQAAEAAASRNRADILLRARHRLEKAEIAAVGEFGQVRTRATAHVGVTEERTAALHGMVLSRGAGRLDMAHQALGQQYGVIRERAAGAVSTVEVQAKARLETVVLASRRSIDGIDGHLHEHWLGIVAGAGKAVTQSVSLADAHMNDVTHYMRRTLREAEALAQDTFKSILAMGVEPTLRRGFALAKADGKPVSSRAAALEHDSIELTFHDGTVEVSTKGKAHHD
ncbi:Exodeoxyribonuclease VII large subunit [Noviherbaspirillum humi]|uniref:Exodeoxyribonuclease VII large subunit n=1 Tax=Noviherbaspirillum humi TaxID=1688639 RepID=A0A239M973_9BURK|nr:exodeoxyribonuclease VII large subunit [Noviherbaspirillum humi]SNT39507.1 Exodeoxyribonuclease VII large subunit [Noviherbaspirillum humi]